LPGELTPGSRFAGLRIDGVLARGGMGVVYRATDETLGRAVALKVVAAELLEDGDMRERFVRESRAAAAIEHPNVIPIYSAGEEDGVAYIAMRLVDGEDLRDRVRRDGPLAPAEAAEVVAQVASALDAAHAAGLVHRDVKPANVLLGAGDHAYLSDFGLARRTASEAALTRTGRWVGTLDYVAPEQIQGRDVDGRADVYALGCVLHYALTGRVPFRRDTDEARLWAHVHDDPPAPSEEGEGVPAAFDVVVRAALAKRPEDRFATAGELGRAARAAARGEEGERLARRLAGAAGEEATTTDSPRPEATRRGGPGGTRGGGAGKARRGGRRAALLATLVIFAPLAAVLAATFLGGGDDDDPSPPGRTQAGGEVRAAAFPVGDQPNSIRLAGGNAWVTSVSSRRLGRIDAETGEARKGPVVGRGARDAAQIGGVLWVTLGEQRRIARLDANDGSRAGDPVATDGIPKQIDAGEGSIWVGESDDAGVDTLLRIDPASGDVVARLPMPIGVTDIRATDGSVWIVGRRRPYLLRVDPATMEIVLRRRLEPKPLRVDVAGGFAWVTNHGDDTVARVDPETGEAAPIGVPSKPYGIVATRDAIWVSCYGAHSLVRIDPRTSRLAGEPRPVGLNPTGVAADGDSVWVASRADDEVRRLPYGG
jgi:streptogramin lyase